ncbi:MAG: DUF559 domain-containing protein [Caulobacter sp.]|nr:DUF559 domain-containing protein [Caulobacter sp.]
MDARKDTRARAKSLRKRMSLPEVLLWRELRRDQFEGLRFRRQHPMGPYVLDFYCDLVRLAIEVDGAMHHVEGAPERDARRDQWLAMAGIDTLRIPARLVLKDMTSTLDTIHRRLAQRGAFGADPGCSPLGELSPRSGD